MFPLRDHTPSRSTPVVTIALIAANVVVFLASVRYLDDPRFLADWALIPALSRPVTFLTSQFLHDGILHLGGNMLFLWIFGDNLEDRMGRLPFLGFYLVSGVAAALAQSLPDPASPIPMVGASGAIAGVMGGYLLLFPKARVDVLLIFIVFFRIVPIHAWLVLALWFGLQVISGINMPIDAGGVAYWAHAGGFAAGLAMTVPLWIRLGGPAFWRHSAGRPRTVPTTDSGSVGSDPPDHARPARRPSPIPRAGHRR